MHRATAGAVSTAKAFRQMDHSVRVITARLETHRYRRARGQDRSYEMHRATVRAVLTAKGFQANRSFGAGYHWVDLGDAQIPEEFAVKTAPTKCTTQNAPSNRGSGLDREASRHKASPPHGALFEQMPASLRQAPLVAVPERSHGPPVTFSSHPPLGNRSRLGHLLRDPTPRCRASAQNKPEA